MSHRSCCVVNCKNTSRKSECKFYKFPIAQWKINQRKKWIAAVRRKNVDGSPWVPKPYDYICSDHFIGGKKSDAESSPSYIPSIFPSIYKSRKVNESSAVNRYNRFMNHRMKKILPPMTLNSEPVESLREMTENSPAMVTDQKIDRECQVNFYSESDVNAQTFICNRLIKDEICYAETQTEIVKNTRSVKIKCSNKKIVDEECDTPRKMFADQETQVNNKPFEGFLSVSNDQEILDLAGVTLANFEFLLKRMPTSQKYVVSEKDRLLIFLMKIKKGLTFPALGVLFGINRTIISSIFYETLQHMAGATRNLIFWPNIDAVRATMPNYFRPQYSNTRVIIDCTEFDIEIPSTVENRIFTYSQYKKNFTAKVLIGITPGGFICLISKVAGGQKSDYQITIESGLLDLLENDDIVFSNKNIPEMKTILDASGKKVQMIMLPFLEQKNNILREETEKTHSIASVKIPVERIIQRLRTYQILNTIRENLFDCIDDIMHICCVLVNLQPPIISDNENVEDRV